MNVAFLFFWCTMILCHLAPNHIYKKVIMSWILLLWGCVGDSTSTEDFVQTETLEPLEEILVGAPASTNTEVYPENVRIISEDGEDYAWVHARGYIHQNIKTVWDALRNDLVYVNQRSVAEYSIDVIESDVFDYVLQENNVVQDIITIEFTNEWRHLAVEGNKGDPQRVVVRWQKIAGTDFIQLIEGSVEIIRIPNEENIVEIRVIEHLKASLDQHDNVLEYVTDLYERWVLVSHGQDIPTY